MNFQRSEGPLRLGVLLSGSGRTLQNLFREREQNRLAAEVVCVASNKRGVRGLHIAEQHGVPAMTFLLSEFAGDRRIRDAAMLDWVRAHDVDLVLLAGYLALLDLARADGIVVLNIHPSLLPDFGGEGYYGHRVHEAVLAAGAPESGCSVHRVDAHFDRGEVLGQRRVPVHPDDDADALAARVFEAECRLYPEVINAIARGEIDLTARE